MGVILMKLTRQNTSKDSMLVDDSQSAVPHLDDAQDFLMYSHDDLTTWDAPYELLADGSRRISGGHRHKQCMTCLKWIDLGNSDSGEAALVNHEGRRRCLATVHDNKLEETRHAATAALADLRQSASLSPHSPYRPPRISSPAYYSPLSPLSNNSSSMYVFLYTHTTLPIQVFLPP
jgi:hypothetical protein